MELNLGLSTGTIVALVVWIIKSAMDYQKIKSDLCNMGSRFEEYKEINNGIFKEIKDELKDLKSLMLDIVKSMPKRDNEK